MSNAQNISTGEYDRASNRHWNIETAGRKFTARAERGWRNNGRGFVTWTIFVWEKTDGADASIVVPFEATSAPRSKVLATIANFVEKN